MITKPSILRVGALALIGSTFVLSVACSGGSGVSKDDYDKVQQQLQAKAEENDQLQKKLADAQKSPTAPAATTTAASSVVALLGAQKVPKPSPTAVPTGTPPTAAPRETPPATYYNDKVGAYFVYAETLATTTASQFDIASTVSCTASARFVRGQKIVFRLDVIDLGTDKRVTDKDETTVKVVMPNGAEVTGRFSQRGGGRTPGAPFSWSAGWDIPMDFPLGAINYKIVITKGTTVYEWRPQSLTTTQYSTLPTVIQ